MSGADGVPSHVELYREHRSSPTGSLSYRELADKYGLTYGQARYRVQAGKEVLEERGLENGHVNNQAEFTQTGANTAVASVHGDRVTSLDELVEACEVDADEWRVQDDGLQIKTYEGFAKKERTDLEYTNGQADGTVERGGLEAITLYSIKAKFVRIEPEPVQPVIHPVDCPVTYNPPPEPGDEGLVRALFLGDAQMGYRRDVTDGALTPFHDRRALDLALQIAIAADVEEVYFGGDMLDMTEWSDRYAREPAFYQTTQPMLYEWHWWLRQFREAMPNARLHWNEGNHEERMRRMLIAHLPMAYGLEGVGINVEPALSLPGLLDLRSLAVEWSEGYPDNLQWLNEIFAVFHGDIARSTPGSTARKLIDGRIAKMVFFHIHRRELVTQSFDTARGRVTVSAYCPGCTCHIDGRVPGNKRGDNWQQGLALADYERDGGLTDIHQIEIEEGRAVFDGRLFTARDRLPDLRRDLDWPFVE
jgi:hypothetical protein